ncbi:deoxyribonuclease TATDN1-like isoform X2 [Biomphalaria glabrata]|uniref:Deoxyribonuclease TATDN1 n=1 Tax=Biomphalaria glabrata TaxID=6526 RepID=A0A9W3AIR7_BIOGL|nr:deoxyribonuclease TATDN1-like isoform X2 [Biomphalaria glabrata]
MRLLGLLKMAKTPCRSRSLNFIDAVYKGVYNGKQCHEDDLEQVLNRAYQHNVQKVIITGGSLKDSQAALNIAKLKDNLYCTVGCHPTRSLEFEKDGQDPENYLQELITLANENKKKVVAVGEMGLDFDRLHFAPKEAQIKYFTKQMDLISATNLPVFFHCRAAHPEFISVVSKYRDNIRGGVVHSFTGTKEEAAAILDLGLYIGINGCSLKTQENIDVMCTIPSNRLMIETDCPYCEIRPTHAGFKYIKTQFVSKKKEKYDPEFCVKSRNEPCTIIQVLEVMSGARQENEDDLADIIYKNTLELFFKGSESC